MKKEKEERTKEIGRKEREREKFGFFKYTTLYFEF